VTHSPAVSVIIATYNWASVLPFSVGSVLEQTFSDFELLVIGDGCTDESGEVVGSFGDRRVQWVNLAANTGHQAGPNNEGQRRARGGVIAYLGHDDLWLPHHLEVLVAAIGRGAPAAHTSYLDVDPFEVPRVFPRDGWVYQPGAWIPPTSMAVSRAVMTRTGGWRMPGETGRRDPDTDFWARLFDVAGPPVWVPHLTCVKLTTSKRRGVYRTRPSVEQAHWRSVIRQAPDPEAAIRAAADQPYVLAHRQRNVALPIRAWRSLHFRTRAHLGLGLKSTTRIRRNRRYKGL